MSELGGKYIQLTNEHKSILDIEKQFINSPDDKLFDIYVNKLVRFKDEFERLMNTNDKDLKQYFSDIKNDITKLRTAIDNKTPLELIKTSFVSAVVRVLVANLL